MSSPIPGMLLMSAGAVFLFLAFLIPKLLESMREHGGREGLGARFTAGPDSIREALGSLATGFSILSSIAVAIIILPFQGQKTVTTIVLGIITFLFFSVGFVWTIYVSLTRPLSGTAANPNHIYWSLRLLLLGLSSTFFTLASVIWS
jgi:hypothetical protein